MPLSADHRTIAAPIYTTRTAATDNRGIWRVQTHHNTRRRMAQNINNITAAAKNIRARRAHSSVYRTHDEFQRRVGSPVDKRFVWHLGPKYSTLTNLHRASLFMISRGAAA